MPSPAGRDLERASPAGRCIDDDLDRARPLYESAREDLAAARRLSRGLKVQKGEAELLAKDEVMTFMGLGDIEHARQNIPRGPRALESRRRVPGDRPLAGPPAPLDRQAPGRPGAASQ